MSCTLYAFEARSIQDYILEGGRLRDMIGGSEQVESLTGRYLDQALTHLDLHPGEDLAFIRRAGGVFRIIWQSERPVEDLRDYWSFLVQKVAPGLSFTQAIARADTLKEANAKLTASLGQDRNRPRPLAPAAAPFAERAPRSGRVAVRHENYRDQSHEYLDEVTQAKRELVSKLLGGQKHGNTQTESPFALLKKLAPQHGAEKYVWPLHFLPQESHGDGQPSLLSGDEARSYVAILHADGNNLGKLVGKVVEVAAEEPKTFARAMLQFSREIGDATRRAVRTAIHAIPTKDCRTDAQGNYIIPLRPLVLGGDDVTVVLPAVHALAFTEVFLKAFERETGAAFAEPSMQHKFGQVLPEAMTACAGIAFVKGTMPFGPSYAVAEELCRMAKIRSRDSVETETDDDRLPGPSCLAFHRIRSSHLPDYQTMRERELTQGRFTTSLQPFAISSDLPSLNRPHSIPKWSDFQEFAEVLGGTSRSAIRELLRLPSMSAEHLERGCRRWRENIEDRDASLPHDAKTLVRLKRLLDRLYEKANPTERPNTPEHALNHPRTKPSSSPDEPSLSTQTSERSPSAQPLREPLCQILFREDATPLGDYETLQAVGCRFGGDT
ncbi:hypothetical protein SCOR_28345 [Sulfidibacter corallicola]|uniref:Cas10/Cmr2 second palm domain-containing protein n=1 Tax=Sulfidibacter corallicola TaxID=2818388 RepID=A0A8A4TN54_SULCO|nr:hypothetical protein [Sulfidibacter corallicola]QTD50532.1 hypothetical protein J3U87_33530 [Sulfidibacter corallicola]